MAATSFTELFRNPKLAKLHKRYRLNASVDQQGAGGVGTLADIAADSERPRHFSKLGELMPLLQSKLSRRTVTDGIIKRKETCMPAQETFLDQQIGGKRIEVIKTYDTRQARDAFDEMDEASRAFLWDALNISATYEESELPDVNTGEGADFLWEELLQESREDGNSLSFFLTFETTGKGRKPRFVAPDWPIAEQYAITVLPKRKVQ